MDPRWQPDLGPMNTGTATPEACALLAAGWRAQPEECRISAGEGQARLVALDTWHALRDRCAFVPARVQMQR
jgi:hypothetical protein